MTLFAEAAALMVQVREQTKDMKTGVMPSVYVLLSLQGECTELYHRLGEEQSRTFTQKELSNLTRKVNAAKAHLKGRREFALTVKDAEMEAIGKTKVDHEAEIAAMELFEKTRILRDSLSRCFDHLQMVISTLKWAEQRPSPGGRR